jgi:2-polyprenyl-3-methyl-5-hydroxy-6-metoxy-1,4-benzoquinol methylase
MANADLLNEKETPESANVRRDNLIERILTATTGAMEMFSLYLGDRLGLYEVLAQDGPLTPAELARRTGTAERYIQEWIEHQTVVGLLAVDDPALPAERRRYTLPEGHEDVLANSESVHYLAPIAQLLAGVVSPLPSLVDAYRTGRGIPYSEYGTDTLEGQGRINRNAFLRQLGPDWLSALPELDERLRQPGAAIADLGCGVGWSSIAMALHYPSAYVDGFDLDAPSIDLARSHALSVKTTSLSDRLQFRVADASDLGLSGKYDLVTVFECLHDMSDPVSALRTMRRLVKEEGMVLVIDERVGSSFLGGDGELDGLMYGWSVLHCLPVGLHAQPSAATGTVMRPATLERYAREAGFSRVEILPVDAGLFRLYRLYS